MQDHMNKNDLRGLRYIKLRVKQTDDQDEKERLERKIARIEAWIRGIDDHLVHDIIVYRYERGFKWSKIARLVGGDNTEDNCRMMVNRYIQKMKNKGE